jgi:hypothetical protein
MFHFDHAIKDAIYFKKYSSTIMRRETEPWKFAMTGSKRPRNVLNSTNNDKDGTVLK